MSAVRSSGLVENNVKQAQSSLHLAVKCKSEENQLFLGSSSDPALEPLFALTSHLQQWNLVRPWGLGESTLDASAAARVYKVLCGSTSTASPVPLTGCVRQGVGVSSHVASLALRAFRSTLDASRMACTELWPRSVATHSTVLQTQQHEMHPT